MSKYDDSDFSPMLEDEQRTAFGLGYEKRRRGEPVTTNPFPPEHWKHGHFIDGWKAKDKLSRSKAA
jgi:hypothetical protein